MTITYDPKKWTGRSCQRFFPVRFRIGFDHLTFCYGLFFSAFPRRRDEIRIGEHIFKFRIRILIKKPVWLVMKYVEGDTNGGAYQAIIDIPDTIRTWRAHRYLRKQWKRKGL